jgi:excisionase family DNA binding protein
MKKKDRGILSVEEAAALLGFHPESVRRLARRGRIPAVKFGARAWAFDSEELREWQKQRDQAPKGGE